jgi:hypothetical protein
MVADVSPGANLTVPELGWNAATSPAHAAQKSCAPAAPEVVKSTRTVVELLSLNVTTACSDG